MQGRSILFVDDDVLTQWITSDALQGAGFHVVSACRGGEAIDLLRENADFDLLMTEVDLPDHMTGMHLGEHWRRLFRIGLLFTTVPVALLRSPVWRHTMPMLQSLFASRGCCA